MLDFTTIDWRAVLPEFGIGTQFLKNKHGPCPICSSGKDGLTRFRFSNKDENGEWYCSSCRGGNGFTLLRLFTKQSDAWLLSELQKLSGQNSGRRSGQNNAIGAQPHFKTDKPVAVLSAEEYAKNHARLVKAWAAAKPLSGTDPVSLYLRNRVPGSQMLTLSPNIRCHPGMPYWDEVDGKPVCTGIYPVMLVKVVDSAGEMVTLHRTFLTRDGFKAPVPEAKKQMSGLRKLSGAGMPIIEVQNSRTIGLTEGLETGLAVATGYKGRINVSAMLNCTNLACADLACERYDDVIIFADHDRVDKSKGYRPGEHYAGIAKKQLQEKGFRVEIRLPELENTDFCDVWYAIATKK